MSSTTGRSEGLARSRSLAPRFFHECLGLLGSSDGQFAWVEETDLSEHTGLIPIDMLVGDFVPFKFHHDNMRHRYSPPGRWNTRKHVINGAVVREIQDELIHHLVPANRARDPLDAGIGGHLTDEVVRVKIDYAGVTVAAGERGHIVDVRFGHHGLHCGGDIVIDELMLDVSVKDRSQVHFLHFLRLLHFLCFLHQCLPARIRFCRIIAAFLPRSAGTACLKFAWVFHLSPISAFGNMVTAVWRSLSTLIRNPPTTASAGPRDPVSAAQSMSASLQ